MTRPEVDALKSAWGNSHALQERQKLVELLADAVRAPAVLEPRTE
jgi:hypothetical protein